jgi:hypothetical protein
MSNSWLFFRAREDQLPISNNALYIYRWITYSTNRSKQKLKVRSRVCTYIFSHKPKLLVLLCPAASLQLCNFDSRISIHETFNSIGMSWPSGFSQTFQDFHIPHFNKVARLFDFHLSRKSILESTEIGIVGLLRLYIHC